MPVTPPQRMTYKVRKLLKGVSYFGISKLVKESGCELPSPTQIFFDFILRDSFLQMRNQDRKVDPSHKPTFMRCLGFTNVSLAILGNLIIGLDRFTAGLEYCPLS